MASLYVRQTAEKLTKKLKNRSGFVAVNIIKRPQSYTRAVVVKKLVATFKGNKQEVLRNCIETEYPIDDCLELVVTPQFIESNGRWYNFKEFHVITKVI